MIVKTNKQILKEIDFRIDYEFREIKKICLEEQEKNNSDFETFKEKYYYEFDSVLRTLLWLKVIDITEFIYRRYKIQDRLKEL